ncbi:cytochrome P450 [Trametes coccinea BRFM310]|uniref:Cytochrome P450 n=1 Tax=Trametes coccinea (strain BRFM310) TaxID=1353009 RepID=A0A1Y2IYZ1_TRAC3|nr:cytochrome P450 [Trametes coccinea BRFM310]
MLPTGILLTFGVGTLLLLLLWRAVGKIYLTPLRALQGPVSPNFFYGHARLVCRPGHTAITNVWTKIYGNNVLCRWLFNTPCLWTADPLVIRHIVSSYNYVKPWEMRISFARAIGDSVMVAEGERHKGQRTILNPAFGSAQIRELANIFVQKSAELRDIWSDQITMQGESARINVLDGLKKMTLDVIGLAGFDYHLEALNPKGKPNELNEAFSQIFSSSPPVSIYRILVSVFPFLDFFPDERARKTYEANVVMRRIGLQLIRDKKAAIMRGLGNKDGTIDKKDLPGKDLLTLLIKANMASGLPDNQRLSNEQVLAQIPTFLVAGHETTSTAAAWCLFALTQHPEMQQKLRDELLAVPTDSPTMDDLAALPYLDRVVRETLRLYAPVTWTLRSADVDDVIPVSEPYVDRYGQVRHEIRIAQGNRVIFSVLAVHHSKAIWGEDALEFKPERWENPPETISEIPSVWGHLLTFSSGPHGCIGYRLSLAELRALMFVLLRAFEFEIAVDPDDVTGVGMFTQRPGLRSEIAKGAQLPLIVRPYVRA